MNRDQLVEMTRHNLGRVKEEATDQTDSIMKVPGSIYSDPVRWEEERKKIFLSLPVVVALSFEISEPNQYRAVEIMERPILVVRQSDGSAQAFLNRCKHRGAKVVADGNGKAARFSCPYHAWTYAASGKLAGVPSRADFGEFDMEENGLTRLPTFERHGFVWAVLDPKSTLDFEAFLCGYDQILDAFDFGGWHLFGRKRLTSANWKLTYDGYVDFYHLPSLHKNTFKGKFSNKALTFHWGPHQRVVTPDPSLLKLEDKPEAEWDVRKMMKGVWPMFPSSALISIDGIGDAMMFSQIFPGNSVSESYSTHAFITRYEVKTDEARAAAEEQFTFLVDVLRDEDYAVAYDIQKNILAGHCDSLMFGRNEPGTQAFHGWVDRLIQLETDAERNALFARVASLGFDVARKGIY